MADRSLHAVALALLVCSAAGCLGLGGGGGGDGIAIRSETTGDGATFLSVASTDGEPLPADTRVTINSTLPGDANHTTTLGRQVDAGTRVYPGGVLTSEAATDLVVGAPPATTNVPRPLYWEVTVTVTVETGDRSVTETFTFGG